MVRADARGSYYSEEVLMWRSGQIASLVFVVLWEHVRECVCMFYGVVCCDGVCVVCACERVCMLYRVVCC